MALKQVILIRQDLKMPKGKLSIQVAHASLEAALECDAEKVDSWRNAGGKKVVLKVKNMEELFSYQKKARANGLTTVLIRDAGLTVLEPGTITCLGIGPDDEGKIDKVTGSLKMV